MVRCIKPSSSDRLPSQPNSLRAPRVLDAEESRPRSLRETPGCPRPQRGLRARHAGVLTPETVSAEPTTDGARVELVTRHRQPFQSTIVRDENRDGVKTSPIAKGARRPARRMS